MKRVALCALALCFLSASVARADASSAAAAEALYDEGKKMEAKGNFTDACPKFAESQKLDPAAGTLLHLANCYEKTGKPASAWVTYLDAASAAHAQNRADWEKAARTKAAALEPKLAHIVISVASPDPSESVRRDESTVTQASFGVPIPVDPGQHVISAEAPKKKAFTTTVNVAGEGTTAEVKIPKLEDAPDTTPPPVTPPPVVNQPPPPKQEDAGSGRKTAGYIVGGLGVAGLAVGAITGAMAISSNNEAKKDCPSAGGCSNKAGVDANDQAKTMGTVSTIGFVAGGVLLAAGIVVVLTAPSSPEKKALGPLSPLGNGFARVELAPLVGPTGGGFSLQGAF